ncbi:hypothetical protein BDV95DRAFT_191518 [Massariosphaeria phaeospora]|uniref:Uncharacterized protein n=1 Tax=Massariosphaeria phaeospora TaxID=100035 RepID=A0A7C8I8E2_9PLEO|nr:hypothetical protein BDV95DRAFT_191518 [Massariosphaeria phaeospora]
MQKKPVPAGADTNTRAYAIFFSYLLTCFSLTVYVIVKLLRNYSLLTKSTTARPPPARHVRSFMVLAAGSIFTRWYFILRYFENSYQFWVMWRSYYQLEPHHMHWGLWLKETSLFREAWEAAIVGNARYWWTHQIFFFACAFGLSLDQRGLRRNIKHTWAFMLLGQIVAISFATNLFLLTLLLSPPALPPPSSAYRKNWLGPWVLNLVAIIATQIPAYLLADEYYWHHKEFMSVLLAPHIALLVLPFVRAILPAKYSTDVNHDLADSVYNKVLWPVTIVGAALLNLKQTWTAVSFGGFAGIWGALWEHPAVSSVAFDVVFCWITWITWWSIQRQGVDDVLGFEQHGKEYDWPAAGSGIAATRGDTDGGVRRR